MRVKPLSVFRWPHALGLLALLATLALAGCGSDASTKQEQTGHYGPTVSMDYPGSLTGTAPNAAASTGSSTTLAGPGSPCDYPGAHIPDPFRNGYRMSQFLVGISATWMCITDRVMDAVSYLILSGAIPADGVPHPIQPAPNALNPVTGIAISQNGAVSTVTLYYHGNPNPGLFLAWDTSSGAVQGRLVVHAAELLPDPATHFWVNPTDPTHMRMDFNYGAATQVAQMYIAYLSPYPSWHNVWANGFRIDSTKTLADGSFVIQGKLDLKRQWSDAFAQAVPGAPLPVLNMQAVADAAGTGAAHAQIADNGVNFFLNNGVAGGPSDSLGNFLFTKDDSYYFQASGLADYIDKVISAASYEGGKNLVASANPPATDLDVETALGLGASEYANCTSVVPNPSADCQTFLSALFAAGQFGVEQNYGTLPLDWRPTALAAVQPLTSVYPTGSIDWSDVFGMKY